LSKGLQRLLARIRVYEVSYRNYVPQKMEIEVTLSEVHHQVVLIT